MQFTAYIYRGLFETNPIDQIEDIRDIDIEEQIDSFSTLSFIVNYYKWDDGLNTKNLQEFLRVKIIKETWSNQETIFDGVIFELVPDFEGVKVFCRDYRWFLEAKRYLTEDKTYTSQNSTTIINDLLVWLNAKTSGDAYPETWTAITDEEKTWLNREWSKGTSYFTVFEELALEMGKNWYIHENGIIELKDIVWDDKTEGDNYVELLFNGNEIAESNIGKIPGVTRQDTMANSIIPATWSIINNTESINNYIRLEEYKSLEGNEMTNYLEKASQPQVIYTLDIRFNELDNEINIGDKVAIRIETGIIHLDIEWEVFITRKKSKISGGEVQTIDVDVSEVVIAKNTFLKKFKETRQEIKNLKIG